jgi:hypothetical protein
MDLLDKVLLEWSTRTEKGYPDLNNEQDLAIFESMFGFKLNEQEEVAPPEKEVSDAEAKIEERIQSLPKNHLPALTKEILGIFKSLKPDVQNKIEKEIGNNSIQEFKSKLNELSSLFAPFFDLTSKGAGKGELLPLLTIKGSKSGGTADKDIIVGNEVLEVKELDASGKFRTAKTGSIRDTHLDANIQTLIKIFKNLEDLPEDLQKQKEIILDYYQQTYKFGSGKPDFFVKYVIGLINGLKKLQLNPKDYLKIKGKKYFYSKNPDGTITLAGEVEENLASLAKLVRHPYYLDPKTLITDFYVLKDTFLDTIDYLLLYQDKQPLNPVLFNSEEAKENVYPYDVNQQTIRLGYGKETKINLEQLVEYTVDNED